MRTGCIRETQNSAILFAIAIWICSTIGCTDAVPTITKLGADLPDRAKIEDNYLAFSGPNVAYGKEITVIDSQGNTFDLTMTHIKDRFRYFAAKTPGLIIKTGVVYKVLVHNAYASQTPVPVVFEGANGGGGTSLPSGGTEGQVLAIVGGTATWTSITTGTLAQKNSVGDAEITDMNYSKLTGVPATFTPSAHTHAISEVTNLQTSLNSKLSKISSGDSFSLTGSTGDLGTDSLDLQTSRPLASQTATGPSSITIGRNNVSSGDNSMSVGGDNKSTNQGSFSLGTNNTTDSFLGRAIGHSVTIRSSANYSTGLGSYVDVSGANSVTTGYQLVNDFDNSVMVGTEGSFKVYISGPIVFKSTATSHQNKTFYCETFIAMTNGSFSKGFAVIKTNASSSASIINSNLRVTFYDAGATPSLSITVSGSLTVHITSSLMPTKMSFECENMN